MDWVGAGDSQSSEDSAHSVCCTRCMLYSVVTVDHCME